jgi:hypothetical protein
VRTDPGSSGENGQNIPADDAGMADSAIRAQERYGRHARLMPSRRVLAAGATLTVLAGLGLAWIGYRTLGDPPISGSVLGWEPTLSGTALSVRFAVHRDHPDRSATCTLRARGKDGAQVGTAAIAVPKSTTQDVAVTADLPISSTAVMAEVYSCAYS